MSKPVKYCNEPTVSDLTDVREELDRQQLRDLEFQRNRIVGCFPHSSVETRLLAEKFFELGQLTRFLEPESKDPDPFKFRGDMPELTKNLSFEKYSSTDHVLSTIGRVNKGYELPYHEKLIRNISNPMIRDMLLKCNRKLDKTIPDNEIWFYDGDTLVAKIKNLPRE